MGRDHLNAGRSLPADEVLRIRPRDRYGENGTHGCPHGLERKGIGGFADQDDPGSAGRVGGADDGAEIARVAHAVERHIGLALLRMNIPER